MDKVKGLEVLKGVIKGNGKSNLVHEDYKRVTELADKYYKLVTGAGIEKLLQQIITRETDEEFKQRTKITKSVCPAILNSTKLPFQKATRKQPIVRKIDFEGDSDKKKLNWKSISVNIGVINHWKNILNMLLWIITIPIRMLS